MVEAATTQSYNLKAYISIRHSPQRWYKDATVCFLTRKSYRMSMFLCCLMCL